MAEQRVSAYQDSTTSGLPGTRTQCQPSIRRGGQAGSDDAVEYQVRDRLSFMRFLVLVLADRAPDAKTIWLFREQLVRDGEMETLFARFDAALRTTGYLTMSGQIIDATLIAALR